MSLQHLHLESLVGWAVGSAHWCASFRAKALFVLLFPGICSDLGTPERVGDVAHWSYILAVNL